MHFNMKYILCQIRSFFLFFFLYRKSMWHHGNQENKALKAVATVIFQPKPLFFLLMPNLNQVVFNS